jgi:hypothetical protein
MTTKEDRAGADSTQNSRLELEAGEAGFLINLYL